MFQFKIFSIYLFISLVLMGGSLTANDEKTSNNDNLINEQPTEKQNEPRILVKYYSAEAIQALPRLKPLANQEPEYNKILFKLENFPKNKEIILEIRRLASDDTKTYERKVSFSIQDDGSMVITNTDHKLQTLIGSSRGYLPGEMVHFRFRTADGDVEKETSGVPAPAILKDNDHNIVLKAELVSVNPTVYQISLPTMDDGEEYVLKSTSIGETIKAKPKYVKDTAFHYAPAANGNSKGGDAILEIRRTSGQVYTIQLPWGSALEGYLSGKKIYSPKPS